MKNLKSFNEHLVSNITVDQIEQLGWTLVDSYSPFGLPDQSRSSNFELKEDEDQVTNHLSIGLQSKSMYGFPCIITQTVVGDSEPFNLFHGVVQSIDDLKTLMRLTRIGDN